MKKLFGSILATAALLSCHKNNTQQKPGYDMDTIRAENAKKASVINGLWGTLTLMEGNCMPMVPGPVTCKTYPVARTIKVYAYTLQRQANPQNSIVLFDSLSTQLIGEVNSDDNGFFQIEVPPGHYTIVAVEKGKLYAFGLDGQSGISPVTLAAGKQQVDLTISYAIF